MIERKLATGDYSPYEIGRYTDIDGSVDISLEKPIEVGRATAVMHFSERGLYESSGCSLEYSDGLVVDYHVGRRSFAVVATNSLTNFGEIRYSANGEPAEIWIEPFRSVEDGFWDGVPVADMEEIGIELEGPSDMRPTFGKYVSELNRLLRIKDRYELKIVGKGDRWVVTRRGEPEAGAIVSIGWNKQVLCDEQFVTIGKSGDRFWYSQESVAGSRRKVIVVPFSVDYPILNYLASHPTIWERVFTVYPAEFVCGELEEHEEQ